MSASPPESPVVSVLICVLNGAAVIGRQLDALAAQESDVPWEVVVADNGSTDETRELVRGRAAGFPVPLRLVDASARRGVSHARNIAARAARGRYLAYCDCDDEVRPGWVTAAGHALSGAPAIAGVNREMLDPPRPDAPVLNPQVLGGVGTLQGCNFGVRRDVFFEIGGFDESLPPYGNDDGEFAIRLRKAGHQVAAAPDMEIYFRKTVGVRSRLRKVYNAGLAEIVIWHRHHDPSEPRLRPLGLVRDVALWPVLVMVAALQGQAPSREKIARGAVLRWAHLVGYFTWIRPDKVGPARLAADEPVTELT